VAYLMQPLPNPRKIVTDLPAVATEVIYRAMAKKPDGRFVTAGEMATVLDLL